jgi:hypothetical protein
MAGSVRRITMFVALLLVALTGRTTPVMAAWPQIMLIYGSPLTKPVILANQTENATLMAATSQAVSVLPTLLRRRPSLRVALFWGERWRQYRTRHKPLAALRPRQADQFARFYPAYGTTPPLFVFDSIPGPYISLARSIRSQGLAVLARHGVPIRLPR